MKYKISELREGQKMQRPRNVTSWTSKGIKLGKSNHYSRVDLYTQLIWKVCSTSPHIQKQKILV